MPHVHITNPAGHTRMITSSDNETVARWLVEVLTEMTSPNPAFAHIDLRIEPLWVGTHEAGAWDWHPSSSQAFWGELRELTPAGNIRKLAQLMYEYAGRIEKP